MDRFWSKVNKNGPTATLRPDLGRCWIWTASTDNRGYGQFWLDGRPQKAHRVAYALAIGPTPPGLLLLRFACILPACVNPAHVRPPVWDGILATQARGNLPRPTCRYGHRLGPENAYRRPNGCIECKQCRLAARRHSRNLLINSRLQ